MTDGMLESKLPSTGTSIFSVMSDLAQDCKAINLSQGFPSFNPDQELLNLVDKHIKNGANQYAPMPGVSPLLDAIAQKVQNLYGRSVEMHNEITVCNGATEGIFSTIQAMVRADDEVIVFDPAYDSYEPCIDLAGGKTIHIPLITSSENRDFHIDWERFKRAINKRTRLVIFNFPHNPTGAILSENDLSILAEIIRGTNIYLMSDEVYEHIVFDGNLHESLLKHDELWERTFVISSFGKTYHTTGWKVGYCVAPKLLTTEFRKIHQWVCYSVVTPIQHAIADYMILNPNHYSELPKFYERKRNYFCDLMAKSRFRYKPAQGTFFQILDYSEITNENDLSYAKQLTQDIGVASIPVSGFCKEAFDYQLLRFCFAKDDITLEEAAARLCQL